MSAGAKSSTFVWSMTKECSPSGPTRMPTRVVSPPGTVMRWLPTPSAPQMRGHQRAERVVADLAHEPHRGAEAPRPDGHVGGGAARHHVDGAEHVGAAHEIALGTDEDVPGDVADDEQAGSHGRGTRKPAAT